MNIEVILFAIIISYAIGSFPTAIFASKIFSLPDPRSYGSGNPGATNVLRSGNKKAAIFTLIGDIAKGTIAVLLIKHIWQNEASLGLSALAAFFAVLGHIFSIWLKFKGGKGVATAIGVLLAYSFPIALVVISVFIIIFLLFRYVSLASIIAALGLIGSIFFGKQSGLISFIPNNFDYLFISLIAILVISRHWQNIIRLFKGKEAKFSRK